MPDTQLDLRRLALDRPTSDARVDTSQRRRLLTRYVIPIALLLGFVAMLGLAAGQHFVPARSVTVCPVIVKRGVVQQSGTPLFQAAGWIEPRPTAITVAALAAGVVEELVVVEGQDVQQGELIARLISVDAEISVELARSTLLKSEGEMKRAEAELRVAKSRRDNPLHLRLPLAEARGMLAKAKTESEKLPFLIEAMQAELEVNRQSYEGKLRAGDAVPGVTVRKAEGDLSATRAALSELNTRGPNLRREIDALEEKVRVLEEQSNLQIDDHGRVSEAEANVQAATALRDQAALNLRRAELDLERTKVCAPMDGRILRLVATPGTRVMGLEHFAGQSSSTVVEMYDPTRLQVRADVRLENVPLVFPGASVEIKTASSEQTLMAKVLQPTSTANIQKNTLEVKVELIDPPPAVRPDMLVTATFLAPESGSDAEQSDTTRILIPEQLVLRDAGSREESSPTRSNATIWIVAPNRRAALQSIQLGTLQSGGLIEVKDGLQVTDKLIVSGINELSEGDRILVRGDDTTMGLRR
ncbi:MAG: HlyD family efflux transporter periplasmic adaptor subunit [Planctomycetota bacterium]